MCVKDVFLQTWIPAWRRIDSLWCSWRWCNLNQEHLSLFPWFQPSSCQLETQFMLWLRWNEMPEVALDHTRRQLRYGCDTIKAASPCSARAPVGCLFVSLFPQEDGETGNGRLLRDLHGRIFLYRFLLLFSGFWPSLRGYSSLHSCCWRTWSHMKRKFDVMKIKNKENPHYFNPHYSKFLFL